jgi:hypothetical protein
MHGALAFGIAAVLSGCGGGGADLTHPGEWFSGFGKPSSTSGMGSDVGFTVSRTGPARVAPGPVPPTELIGADGGCAGMPAPAPETAGAAPAPALSGQGITLAMTECQLVSVAGRPDHVDIGAAAGERRVVLTYNAGQHPGTYTFEAGRLKVINATPVEPKPQPRKRTRSRRKPS